MAIQPKRFTDCEGPPPSLVSAVERGLRVEGGRLTYAKMLQGRQNAEVFYVSANIESNEPKGTSELGMAVGVWATPALEGNGPIFSVTPPAHNYSVFGPGSTKHESRRLFADAAVNQVAACTVTEMNFTGSDR